MDIVELVTDDFIPHLKEGQEVRWRAVDDKFVVSIEGKKQEKLSKSKLNT